VYDWDKDGTHDFIGSFSASLQEITTKTRFDLVNPNKKSSMMSSSKKSGEVMIISAKTRQCAPKTMPQAYTLLFRGIHFLES
tara:strand:- start:1058 stop:1303 length:246 start_codon:yes stop_codon:yes gene_type:complete